MVLTSKHKMCSISELEMKHYQRQRTILNTFKTCEWENLEFVNYINLMDMEKKKESAESVPWFNVEVSEKSIIDFCSSSLFTFYKSSIMSSMLTCDKNQMIDFLRKILRVVELFKITRDIQSATILYSDLLECFYKRKCKNPVFLLNLWHNICSKSEQLKMYVFVSLVAKNNNNKSTEMLKCILELGQQLHFDFWDTWLDRYEVGGLKFCPVTHALLNGSFEQLLVLFCFGFQQNSKRVSSYDRYFISSVNSDYRWFRRPLREYNLTSRSSILLQTLLFLEVFRNSFTNPMRQAALANCFKLLWKTVPYPLITKQELRNEVHRRLLQNPPRRTFGPATFPRTLFHLLKLCDAYDVLQKEKPLCYISCPRSLLHLSRCSIREALRKSWSLPHGIDQLCLPSKLKAYLNLQPT